MQPPPLDCAQRRRRVVVRSEADGSGEESERPPAGERETRDEKGATLAVAERQTAPERKQLSDQLGAINPLNLGRRSRQFIDDVWSRVLDLGNVVRTNDMDNTIIVGGAPRGLVRPMLPATGCRAHARTMSLLLLARHAHAASLTLCRAAVRL